jgi:hypothetical protein
MPQQTTEGLCRFFDRRCTVVFFHLVSSFFVSITAS